MLNILNKQILHEREKSEFEATSSDLAEARKVVDQIRTELDQLDRKKQSLANEYQGFSRDFLKIMQGKQKESQKRNASDRISD